MRRSLFFKLLGAFALVILVLAVIVSVLVNRATARQFRLYADRNGQLWAAQLAPQLADYYARQGSWQGVEAALQGANAMMGPGMGMMMDGGMMHRGAVGRDMWSMMGLRVVLADPAGRVLSDSAGVLVGQTLAADQLAAGASIQVNGRLVGTVLVAAQPALATESPAAAFLRDVNRSILLAVAAAGLIALALGAGLFFHLTAPIRQLTAAAHAIAAGDLSRRVAVRSADELGELAVAFNAMAANLAAAEAQRRQMVADIAHELRTPLSVLQANLEAMQDGILPADDEQLASLHEETLLLSRLVADLRLLSLAEAGQLKLDLAETDLGELVCRAAERLRPAAEARGIELVVEVVPDPPRIQADAGRLAQVIGNLVDNALRYTPAGGRIVLAAGWSDGSGLARRPMISVTDTGQGIAAEDLPHIFDRFYRGDKSRARASGGSGLGLAIVKQLVEAHGGRVWAESPAFSAPDGREFGARIVMTF
jgi:two-component system OmpR family sensor kinase